MFTGSPSSQYSYLVAVVFVFYRRMVVPVALGGSGKIFEDQEPQLAQEVGTLIFNKEHSLPYQKPFMCIYPSFAYIVAKTVTTPNYIGKSYFSQSC